MPNIPEDELRRQILDYRIFCFVIFANMNDGTYTQKQFYTEIKKQDDKLVRSIRQYAAKERLDELNRVKKGDFYSGNAEDDLVEIDNHICERIKQLKKGQV